MENLFTPWHIFTLSINQVYAINRMCKIIYENMGRVRHDINSAPLTRTQNYLVYKELPITKAVLYSSVFDEGWP